MLTYLSPIANGSQYFDNNGLPLVGGRLYTFLAGTSTPVETYSDLAGAVPNTNPIVLNSAGRVPVEIRQAQGVVIKFVLIPAVLTDPLFMLDDVQGVNDVIGTDPETNIPFWVDFGVTPVKLTNNSFAISGNFADVTQLERRIRLTQPGGQVLGSITSAVVTEPTPGSFTTTITLRMDAGAIISSSVSMAEYSIINPNASPVPTDYALQQRVIAVEAAIVTQNATIAALQTYVQNLFPVGCILLWPKDTAPAGWKECNNQAILRASYPLLFAAIGTTFGPGDGSTTFNLPDTRGTFVRGWDDGRGLDAGRAFGSSQLDSTRVPRNTSPQRVTGPGTSTPTGNNPSALGFVRASLNGVYNSVGDPDGVHGQMGTFEALTGDPETRPVNIAMMYMIRVDN